VNASYTSFNQPATTGAATVISNRHYLSAGGQSIGVQVSSGALPGLYYAQPEVPMLSSIRLSKVEYSHKDHLGSLVASTDHSGAVTARYAYDPFGKRRYTNGTYDAFGKLTVDWSNRTNSGVDRGYTGHEHLDDIGIIHMNGRLFEPRLGRFLQADTLDHWSNLASNCQSVKMPDLPTMGNVGFPNARVSRLVRTICQTRLQVDRLIKGDGPVSVR